ncbi:MAG: SRPBCC domain-containing protein [Calditrichaceae bacterium]
MWRKMILILMIAGLVSCKNEPADIRPNNYGVFSFEQQLTLPGTPELVFDAITGDISEWWDHSFSETPLKFYIDPKPGGGFYEIFDESGDGVLHATVIYAERGKALRFDGPLGLSGKAVQMVTTYRFESAGQDSTALNVSVHVAGEVEDGLPETVKAVWHHFIFERFKPFMEAVYQKSR